MVANRDVRNSSLVVGEIKNSDSVLVPERYVNLGSRSPQTSVGIVATYDGTYRDSDNSVRVAERLDFTAGWAFGARQVNSLQSSSTAHIIDNAETVSQIVRDKQSVSVSTDRDSGRIDWRLVSVIPRRRRRPRESVDIDERRSNF